MRLLRNIIKFQIILRNLCEIQLTKQIKKIGALLILQRSFRQKIAKKKLVFLKKQKAIDLFSKSVFFLFIKFK